jgi:predicted AAA+ superfamily ATPase
VSLKHFCHEVWKPCRNQEVVTFFLDEIQLVAGWESFVRRILDSENVDVFLSGSSARLLSREVATSMRGRAVEAIVYPFSFGESLCHAGVKLPADPSFLSGRQRSTLEKAFRQYLACGGFPEAQALAERDRRHLLQGYVDIVILRDIAERHQMTNLPAIRWLVRQLLANAGGPFSANRFHNDLRSQKIRVSIEGLLQIFGHLEDAFLIHGVPIEAGSERKRQVNPRKTYPIDTGLIHAFDRTGRENLGHALENVVLVELLRRGADVTWVRTPGGFEIDFLARYPGGATELIQVAALLENPATIEREFRALADARTLFKHARLRLLTLNQETGTRTAVPMNPDVDVIPAYEWLLSTTDARE